MRPDRAVDIRPASWNAGKAKAGCANSRPAFNPGGLMISAGGACLDRENGLKDCPSARKFQGGRRGNPDDFARPRLGGALCSRRESGMDKASFLEFLAQFQVYRHIDGAGDQTIPRAVVVAAFDAWEKSRSLWPIADWERVQAFLNEVPGQVFDDAFLDWAHDVVESRGWWQSDDWHQRWEVEKFRRLVAKHRRINAEREAIRLRRAEADRALSDPELRHRVFERDGYKCRSCSSHELLAVDHIVAVINGGSDDFENLQALCRSCNSSKGRKELSAWRRREKRVGK